MIDSVGINRELNSFVYDSLVTTGMGFVAVLVVVLTAFIVIAFVQGSKPNDWS